MDYFNLKLTIKGVDQTNFRSAYPRQHGKGRYARFRTIPEKFTWVTLPQVAQGVCKLGLTYYGSPNGTNAAIRKPRIHLYIVHGQVPLSQVNFKA